MLFRDSPRAAHARFGLANPKSLWAGDLSIPASIRRGDWQIRNPFGRGFCFWMIPLLKRMSAPQTPFCAPHGDFVWESPFEGREISDLPTIYFSACCLSLLPATWQLSRIQVETPILGRIYICRRNHTPTAPRKISSSVIILSFQKFFQTKFFQTMIKSACSRGIGKSDKKNSDCQSEPSRKRTDSE